VESQDVGRALIVKNTSAFNVTDSLNDEL